MDNLISHLEKLFKRSCYDKAVYVSQQIDLNTINSLEQDNIIIVSNNNTNINELKSTSIEYITLNDYILARKNSPYQLQWLDSKGNINFDDSFIPIYRRCLDDYCKSNLYKMSNCNYIIYNILSQTNPNNKNFVEMGVAQGYFTEIISKIVNNVYGVDIQMYNTNTPNIKFFNTTTDYFCANFLDTLSFDYCFIDADHKSSHSFIDFENIYKKINIGGYIFMHDTYPGTLENLKPGACNDCYKTPFLIREKYPSLKMITIPSNPGLTIIQK
jgi:predicted O-methyltransferase YrrM